MFEHAVKPMSLSDQVKEQLAERIVTGDLKPGDRLIELSIAKDLGTSQAPVREALRQLEALGLIEYRRNRGAVVRDITTEELAEIYAVRAELEGYAVSRVAGMCPEVGEGLLSLCQEMELAVGDNDVAAFVTLNTAFHRTIIEGAGNGTLLKVWETLDIQLRTAMNTAQTPGSLDKALKDHRRIARAVKRGAAEAARAALVAHINGVVR